jgi:hypothetical protein
MRLYHASQSAPADYIPLGKQRCKVGTQTDAAEYDGPAHQAGKTRMQRQTRHFPSL